MEIAAVREWDTDYVETANLATKAFETPGVEFHADHVKWFYEKCFSLGSTVIALRAGDKKVGHIALIRQTVMLDGKPYQAAQLADLFILRGHRGKTAIKKIYGEIERQLIDQGIRFAIAMPNKNAMGINQAFLKLGTHLRLPLRVGVAMPLKGRKVTSFEFTPLTVGKARAVFAEFETPSDENGMPWNAEAMVSRLQGFSHRYGVHAAGDVLLISSPHVSRNFRYTMLCGFFVRAGASPSRSSVRAVVRSACALWRLPVFAYAGVNERLPMVPGFLMPEKARPSPLVLQLRDFTPKLGPVRLDRFQILDTDLG